MMGSTVTNPVKNINPQTYSVRLKCRKNSKDGIRRDSVTLDGKGNILARPRVTRYSQFGNPVAYLFGMFDQPTRYKGHETPKGCGGCKARLACQMVAEERLESDEELKQLREDWEDATKRIGGVGQFQHPAFGKLRAAIEVRTWADSHDKLVVDEKRRKDRNRKKVKGKRHRGHSPEMANALKEEWRKREAELLAARLDRRSDHRFRKLTDERCRFTAHVWFAEQWLGLAGQDGTASEIARWMIGEGATYDVNPQSMPRCVNEALKRRDWLEGFGGEDAVWTPFVTPEEKRRQAWHASFKEQHTILEPDDLGQF